MTKKIEIVPTGMIQPDLVLELFVFFSEKFSFSLEGLVKVRYLVLARTRDDFGATLPGGSI